MSYLDPTRQQQTVVAVASSALQADMLVMTLSVYGIPATVMNSAAGSGYPSLEWVEGLRVCVADEHAAEARRLLEVGDDLHP